MRLFHSKLAVALIAMTASLAEATRAASATAEPPMQYIVHFDPQHSVPASVSASHARRKRSASPALHYVRSLASGGDVFIAPQGDASILASMPGVISVEEDRWFTRTAMGEPLWHRQWYMHDARVGIDAAVAWQRTRGEGAVVAVLDTGVTPHPEFDGQLLPGYDFISDAAAARDGDGRDDDPTDEGDWLDTGECHATRDEPSSWHGSHVAGIVAARAGNALGITGVAPAAKVLPVRVLGRCGARMSDLVDAIVWASGGEVAGVPLHGHRVDVINLSLGGPGPCGIALTQAIAQARARGTAVVASAGNQGAPASAFAPANCPGVVSVGALARDGSMAWYSNHGAALTLVAPGGSLLATGPGFDDIVSTVYMGQRSRYRPVFGYYAGTSMAAPQVSGVVALMRSVDPRIGVDAITQQLVDNARPVPGRCPKGCGAGLLDAGATVDAVAEERRSR